MKSGNLAYHLQGWNVDAQAVKQSTIGDDVYLDQMRGIIKTYVLACHDNKMTIPKKRQSYREFEDLRSRLSDPMLKEYSSFEFMEKLYLQEYHDGAK